MPQQYENKLGAVSSPAIEKAVRYACDISGISALKEKQVEAITALMRERDVFVCLPTGYGKSLCYALLPLAFDCILVREQGTSIVICISPLIALMMEQRDKFITRGISAEFVGVQQDLSDMALVKRGRFSFCISALKLYYKIASGGRCCCPDHIEKTLLLLQ